MKRSLYEGWITAMRRARGPRCRRCGERFVAAVFPISTAKQPPNVNMPDRYVWSTPNPTVCQNCAAAQDLADWYARVNRACATGSCAGLNETRTYDARAGAFVRRGSA